MCICHVHMLSLIRFKFLQGTRNFFLLLKLTRLEQIKVFAYLNHILIKYYLTINILSIKILNCFLNMEDLKNITAMSSHCFSPPLSLRDVCMLGFSSAVKHSISLCACLRCPKFCQMYVYVLLAFLSL